MPKRPTRRVTLAPAARAFLQAAGPAIGQYWAQQRPYREVLETVTDATGRTRKVPSTRRLRQVLDMLEQEYRKKAEHVPKKERKALTTKGQPPSAEALATLPPDIRPHSLQGIHDMEALYEWWAELGVRQQQPAMGRLYGALISLNRVRAVLDGIDAAHGLAKPPWLPDDPRWRYECDQTPRDVLEIVGDVCMLFAPLLETPTALFEALTRGPLLHEAQKASAQNTNAERQDKNERRKTLEQDWIAQFRKDSAIDLAKRVLKDEEELRAQGKTGRDTFPDALYDTYVKLVKRNGGTDERGQRFIRPDEDQKYLKGRFQTLRRTPRKKV